MAYFPVDDTPNAAYGSTPHFEQVTPPFALTSLRNLRNLVISAMILHPPGSIWRPESKTFYTDIPLHASILNTLPKDDTLLSSITIIIKLEGVPDHLMRSIAWSYFIREFVGKGERAGQGLEIFFDSAVDPFDPVEAIGDQDQYLRQVKEMGWAQIPDLF